MDHTDLNNEGRANQKSSPGLLFTIGFIVFLIAVSILYVIFPTLHYIGVFRFNR